MTVTYDENEETLIISNLVIDGETIDLSGFTSPYISTQSDDFVVIGDADNAEKFETFGTGIAVTVTTGEDEEIVAEIVEQEEDTHPWWWYIFNKYWQAQ